MMCSSYVPKVNQAAISFGTMHKDNSIQECTPFKLDEILHYNLTKGSVDRLDRLVNNYTCKHITKRWPIIVFHWMPDVATYNSAVCFMEKNLMCMKETKSDKTSSQSYQNYYANRYVNGVSWQNKQYYLNML